MKPATYCESCFMPFVKDTGKRESDKYCSKCFGDGKLRYEGNNVKEFQKMAYEGMIADGMNKWKAKLFTWMIKFAPRWKNQK